VGWYVVSGAASGMGAATAALLRDQGHEVLGIDVRDADVIVDLGDQGGRDVAVEAVQDWCRGRLDGAALFAGVVGLSNRPAGLLAAVNYFGSVRLFDGLRPLLAEADEAYALAVCSNSMTCQPGWSEELVEALLSGDEEGALFVADKGDSIAAYPATKTALARWVRRVAPSQDWVGAGIRLNALAPGRVDTPMIQQTRADPVLGRAVDAFPVPLGRGADPAEVAHLAAFMLTRASFMVGSIVLADGGTEALLRPDVYPVRWDRSDV
jgi:NAD(P)-dependent dehydrogenase (short-subunit alcohol dehydrogenase family)